MIEYKFRGICHARTSKYYHLYILSPIIADKYLWLAAKKFENKKYDKTMTNNNPINYFLFLSFVLQYICDYFFTNDECVIIESSF